ncbi:hypothetical protein Q5P01_000482 [Channa striata]|uniref:UPAR/Ly6 domain-containing protein n=1 Tax=Channa striata TaxID=64152 RepID=A0AA88LF50_CHASR|nr:hypothetical protein Q5P01_000482 [Channa striata]
MMKLILCLTLICGIFSTAGALQCQTCTDSQCSTTELTNCSSETMCVTLADKGTALGKERLQIHKGCEDSLCPDTGDQSFSLSMPEYNFAVSVQCCNRDNCNTEPPQFLNVQPNGLKCYSCDTTNSSCSNKVQCKGMEDRCFKANVTLEQTTLLSGCLSANLCSTISDHPIFPHTINITCCGTNLCNSASSITTTITCLLLGFLVFSFF